MITSSVEIKGDRCISKYKYVAIFELALPKSS